MDEVTTTLAERSTSETVRRHASAFVRTWPEPEREYVTPPPSPKTATAIGLDELGTARTKRVQLAKLAEAHGWQWRATTALGPDGRESVVLRLRRPGAFPWHCERAVAYWSGPRLPFVAAFAWQEYGGRLDRPRGVEAVPDEPVQDEEVPPGWVVPVRVSAAGLAEHLATARCR